MIVGSSAALGQLRVGSRSRTCDAVLEVAPLDGDGKPLDLDQQFENLLHAIYQLEAYWAMEDHIDQQIEHGPE